MNKEIYFELLSLLLKNFPRTLIANVFIVFDDLIDKLVLIASYNIAFPGFLL
jgi:hypothetical protein